MVSVLPILLFVMPEYNWGVYGNRDNYGLKDIANSAKCEYCWRINQVYNYLHAYRIYHFSDLHRNPKNRGPRAYPAPGQPSPPFKSLKAVTLPSNHQNPVATVNNQVVPGVRKRANRWGKKRRARARENNPAYIQRMWDRDLARVAYRNRQTGPHPRALQYYPLPSEFYDPWAFDRRRMY